MDLAIVQILQSKCHGHLAKFVATAAWKRVVRKPQRSLLFIGIYKEGCWLKRGNPMVIYIYTYIYIICSVQIQ